jgi:serine/threonine protein phosphatase PrpC
MPQLCKYGYLAAAASHKGRVRSANEDSFGICADEGLFVVCDGMGGAAAGEVASRVAVDAVLKSLCGPRKAVAARDTDPGPIGDTNNSEVPGLLRDAVSDANHLVFSQAANDSRLHGMGTTLVALLAHGSKVWVAHVGDSRCYRYREGVLEQLTRDHSLVDEQVKLGQLTREEADRSPLRNVITRAVGSQRSVSTEISEVDTEHGDLFLLCSDGLTRELPDVRIETLLKETNDLDAICKHLIDAANDAGGRDNVTCVVVRTV